MTPGPGSGRTSLVALSSAVELPELPLIIPIRHHSPACARLVRDEIRRVRPELVLVEGPADATGLIPLLTHPETVPPVALMAYQSTSNNKGEGRPEVLFYPFCSYSPEWVALTEGAAVGAELRFCDLPAGRLLLEVDSVGSHGAGFGVDLAHRYGFRSHEEWWEAEIEGRRHSSSQLIAMLMRYGSEIAGEPDQLESEREAAMWRTAVDAMERGVDPKQILLVVGAAHAPRMPAVARPRPRPSSAAASFALTPYTYAHLARSSGYLSGGLTPQFWQRAWEQGSLSRAADTSLVEIAAALRNDGADASTADAIAAAATARQLAGLRGKSSPGADEVRQAAGAIWPTSGAVVRDVLVGSAAGQLGQNGGESPLAADFHRRARRYWRKLEGAPRQLRLRLTDQLESEKSQFLHQLRVLEVPFAALRDARDEAGSGLWRRYEVWILQWTPGTEISLNERAPWGVSVSSAAAALLGSALEQNGTVKAASEELLDAALAGLFSLFDAALQKVDRSSLLDAAWEDLAHSTSRLVQLERDTGLPESVRTACEALRGRLLDRTLLHLAHAARCSSDRAISIGHSILELHSVLGSLSAEAERWGRCLLTAVEEPGAAPYVAGVGSSLLHAEGAFASSQFGRLIGLRLSPAVDAGEGAAFIEGLLSVNREVLLRSSDLAGVLNGFVSSLSASAFQEILPALRRSFAGLTQTQTSALLSALRNSNEPASPNQPLKEQAAVEECLACLSRLLEHGLGTIPPELRKLMTCLVSPGAAKALKALKTLEDAHPEGRVRAYFDARFELLSVLRSDAVALDEQGMQQLPGLSVRTADLPEITERLELTDLLVDRRFSTRECRMKLVSGILENSQLTDVLPLLSHGQYAPYLVELLSRRSDAVAAARYCLRARNAMIRRAGGRILRRLYLTPEKVQRGVVDLLTELLSDESLWKDSYRTLSQRPALLLVRLRQRRIGPTSGLPSQTAARLIRCIAAAESASEWIRMWLGSPDLCAVEAASMLVVRGELTAAELERIVNSRDLDAAPWIRRARIFNGKENDRAFIDSAPDDEITASLPVPVLQRLAAALRAASRAADQTSLVELLGTAGWDGACSVICQLSVSARPLLLNSAAEALGRIGSPVGAGCLLKRRAARGSDSDSQVLSALAEIGDVRLMVHIGERIRTLRPELVLSSEIEALRTLGEAADLIAFSWLGSGSASLMAVAEILLEESEPAALARWKEQLPALERVRQLIHCLLVPGGVNEAREQELRETALTAGASAAVMLVSALKVAAMDAEAALIRAVCSVRSPAVVLPLLRLNRPLHWKLSIVESLGEIAAAALKLALREPDSYVSTAARELLHALTDPAAPAAAPRLKSRKRR